MSISRNDLLEMKRKAEEEYRRDIAAIDRMLERFCVQESVPVSREEPTQLPAKAKVDGNLERLVSEAITTGGNPSPWTAQTVYRMLKDKYPFRQQEQGAINSVLAVLKSLAARGFVHEEKGSGRRPSLFTWEKEHYPSGESNKAGLDALGI